MTNEYERRMWVLRGFRSLFKSELFGRHVLRTRDDVGVVTFLEREVPLNELFLSLHTMYYVVSI